MRCAVVFTIILCLVGVDLFASDNAWKEGSASRGWGTDSEYQEYYNSDEVIMLSGKVIGVDKVIPLKGMSPGIALKMRTDKNSVVVHLGPAWYIKRLEYRISIGDTLEIKGATACLNHQSVVLAAEVRNGKRFLILRDHLGTPVWTGWGWKR